MGTIYVISDLHFGHKNMAIRRGFKSVEEHDENIITKWNSVVKKKDTVWILGDITMESQSSYPLLDKLLGYKKVILGNHDMPNHYKGLQHYVNSIAGMVNYKTAIMTHCPIHPSELEFRYSMNIHGHVHENTLDDKRYINVSCEAVDYTPLDLKHLIEEYEKNIHSNKYGL